jgi:hypothetical protein
MQMLRLHGVTRENKLCYMLETPCIRRYSLIINVTPLL